MFLEVLMKSSGLSFQWNSDTVILQGLKYFQHHSSSLHSNTPVTSQNLMENPSYIFMLVLVFQFKWVIPIFHSSEVDDSLMGEMLEMIRPKNGANLERECLHY